MQNYVDPGFRFSGLWSFARHLIFRGEHHRSN
jgi:hypothetical protein